MEFSQWVKERPNHLGIPDHSHRPHPGDVHRGRSQRHLSLVVLGFWPAAVPMKPFARAFPLLWLGFGINAVTGTMMLVADATTKLTSLDFYLKMAFVFAGLYVLIRMRRQVFEDPTARSGLRCRATRKCWRGLRWPAGLAQLSPAACWPTLSKALPMAPLACRNTIGRTQAAPRSATARPPADCRTP